eukprot:CAMPEP_0114360108 /NCGR_PEP_ID=MMETSP0101-20121206/23577_1 /TAXON_ID=38822 ORGANISM="Pteridomonas danica, Strain PT" /NCGR_SAMPLE_ID=MMETSP0101 /ASSEMBLY_ACC=CAM_ASM_000211 /LENGTH=75 /DNA_ID=CAMNT_0001504101 /DNA_START=111 /DNA_END=338 /DNA_ORIENTATION=-
MPLPTPPTTATTMVEPLSLTSSAGLESNEMANEMTQESPECTEWKKKQSLLEKGLESTLARALVALGPLRADSQR